MGINKGKGLSVPSPYFDLWLLSVESESNKRPILFAQQIRYPYRTSQLHENTGCGQKHPQPVTI